MSQRLNLTRPLPDGPFAVAIGLRVTNPLAGCVALCHSVPGAFSGGSGTDSRGASLVTGVTALAVLPAPTVCGGKPCYSFREALRGFLSDGGFAQKERGFAPPLGTRVLHTPALRDVAQDAVEALEGSGIYRPGLRLDLFAKRIGEYMGCCGTLNWALIVLEYWRGWPISTGRHVSAPLLQPCAFRSTPAGKRNV